jgi:hypothetical protein
MLTRHFVTSCCAFSLGLVLLPCGARTGLNFPDTRPLPPPLCSEPISVQVLLTPDPDIPSVHADRVSRVDWNFRRRCATDVPQDPREGRGGRLSHGCYITQYVRGGTEIGGDCIGAGFDPAPTNFRVGTTFNRPNNIGFMFITSPGNICVSGTVHFSDGTPPTPIPLRMWRTPVSPLLWLRNAPSDPTVIGLVSADECPNN